MVSVINKFLGALAIGSLLLLGCREKEEEVESSSAPKGAESVQSIAGELKGRILEFAVAVRSPRDPVSAKMAADMIVALGDEMEELAERLAKLEVPPDEIRKKLGREIRAAEHTVEEEMGDAEDQWEQLGPASSEILTKGLEAFGKKMGPLRVVLDEYFSKEELGE
jgi:phosphate uptake regulator